MTTRLISLLRTLRQLAGTLLMLLVDACRYLRLCLRSPAVLAAENPFLRKQLALPLVRLAAGLVCRATGDVSPLASCRVPAIVALEVSSRTATDAGSAASADARARPAGVAPYRAEVYRMVKKSERAALPAVINLP